MHTKILTCKCLFRSFYVYSRATGPVSSMKNEGVHALEKLSTIG